MRNRILTRLIVGLALLPGAAPASAAVTLRGIVPEDGHPRSGWLERYQDSRQGPETTERVLQTFKVGADGALDLAGVSGDVRVTGGAGNEIRIEAVKRVRQRNADEAKRLLNDLRIEMTNLNGRVEVRTLYPRRGSSGERGQSGRVDYTVTVPAGVTVWVKSISGDVTVSDVRGEVRAETISGDVTVESTPNLAIAKTVSGNVVARDAGGASTVVLGTISGSVIATGLRARVVEAGSVSGDVRLSGTQVERVSAKSVSGSLEFDAPFAKGGRYEFMSHSGNVRVVVSGGMGFELDADSYSGSVRSDVPVTLRSVGGTGGDRRRGSSNRAIRGVYGDAGAVLAVRSHSGSVVITKK